MTAYGSIAHAVEAIRRGADDYLGKPFERVDDHLMLVHRGGEGEFSTSARATGTWCG
jgi:ActR/RegA family two-component response regulator